MNRDSVFIKSSLRFGEKKTLPQNFLRQERGKEKGVAQERGEETVVDISFLLYLRYGVDHERWVVPAEGIWPSEDETCI